MFNSATMKRSLPLALLAVVIIAAMAVWAFMGGVTGGVKDGLKYQGTVEYKVFGADGVLKDSGISHNSINQIPGIEDAVDRLVATSASLVYL